VRRFALLLGLVACQSALETSTTQQEIIVLSPASHDFGTLQIGQQSAAFVVSVNPSAGANFNTVSSITASCPDFIISAAGLPADVYRTCLDTMCPGNPALCPAPPPVCQTDEYVTYQFDTYFKPTVAGLVSCVVTVHADTGDHTLTLSGTGQQPPVDIDVSPTSIAFGDVRRNTDSTAVGLTVRNLGGSTMTVSAASASSGYTMSGMAAPYNVNPGGSTVYQIKCHPTATGAMPGTFSITSNDPMTPTVNIPLSCNGIDSNIDISPSPAVLATTRVGEPVMKTITITNTGMAPSTLQSVSVTGGMAMVAGPPPGTVLNFNGTAQVMVSFDASVAGAASSTLEVTYDAGMMRTAQISAMALSTSMSLTPDGDVDFGPVCIGQSKQQSFTILANDQGPFAVKQMSVAPGPFTVMAPTLPANVLGSGANNVPFTITAAPTDPGDATSVVEIDTDIPMGAPRMINLDVTGLAAGVTPTPIELDLGSQPIQTTAIGQAIKLSNCSTSAIGWSNARIAGPDAAEFAIVAQPDATTIPPAGFAGWLIVLTPHTVGIKSATFLVDYDGGTAMVPLDGEGLGAGGTSGEKSSYYACSAGGATGAWPIVLVVAFVARRRRRG
jgi:uncharacterized protein (TIGR03382 family)